MYEIQRGIALVEAVLAIVFLGIIGVTALGQFDDLSDATAASVYKSVDAKISSAAAINYTARILESSAAAIALDTGDDCTNSQYPAAFPSDFDAADYGGTGTGINCR